MIILALCFGLAIFLYAMQKLESGIQLAGGDGLKRWIAAGTSHPASSAGSGIIVTAILQSSSMVSLVALAFVSAGIMPLYNGIGVVLGANLGTTVTGWVVTVIGFKLNLEALIVPLLGVGAALTLAFPKDRKLRGLGRALFAFGLLVYGLDLMKDSVSGLPDAFDLAALKDRPAWVYLVAGMSLAAIMQSSSAVMIITLSLLHSDIVNLTDAAAIVIGADLGTTSTTVLGSIGGTMIKKQLAFAHVFFNLLVNGVTFIFLLPLLPVYLEWLTIEDPMFGLVAFHSTFNLLGLLLFLPGLKHYTNWIEGLLVEKPETRWTYFEVPVEVANAALDSLSNALVQLNQQTIRLHLQELDIQPQQLQLSQFLSEGLPGELPGVNYDAGSFESSYEMIKLFEGDLMRYANTLRHTELAEEQQKKVGQIVESARSLVYASKTLKDIRGDLKQLRRATTNALAVELTESHLGYLSMFFQQLVPLLLSSHDRQYILEQCESLHEIIGIHHQHANDIVTQHLSENTEDLHQVSTWFNLNHELHHYSRHMISALQVVVE